MSKESLAKGNYVTMKFKMNPTQFNNPDVEDIQVLVKNPTFDLLKGDVIKLKG